MGFDLQIVAWICVAISAVVLLMTYLLSRPLCRVGAMNRDEVEENYADGAEAETVVPKVSVIVHSLFPEEELPSFLEMLGRQDYPNFEVVVVCEETSAIVEPLTERCAGLCPNLYITFLPPGSHNLSRRKLSLTIGMKAAKGDVVVTTVSNAVIPSERWLSKMMEPFSDPGVEIVLGCSHTNYRELRGLGRWYKVFQSVLTEAMWMGYALGDKPYRGDGYNLAFRRELFFEHKGYSKSQYLHAGDDDLFVNEIVAPGNSRLVCDADTLLTINWEGAANRVWRAQKEQYSFTQRWLPKAAFRRAGAISAMQWLMVLAVAGGVVMGLPGIVAPAVSVAILLLFWGMEIWLYRRLATCLEATRLWWSVPIFWLARPVTNWFFAIGHYGRRNKNYTWQR